MPPAHSNIAAPPDTKETRFTLLCFAHLRWNFVYQRPQHLMSRASLHADVFYVEEPLFQDRAQPVLQVEPQPGGVTVITPLLPFATTDAFALQRDLLNQWLEQHQPRNLAAWYYTPMALLFSDHIQPEVTVYDCMDQLSAFQGAPPELIEQERRLFAAADVVFTGGRSLFEEKRSQHENVHLLPSSVDRAHFAAAREARAQSDPPDQAAVPHPRIGFFGVLDERLDRDLLREAATREPSWHFVMIGPVVKIREEDLPRANNIHYLGQKSYAELPLYLAHWDVAMLPFAQNASTRFISPTKTPEYLSAGKPVVSTPICDVVEPYGRLGLVRIAANAEQFCQAIDALLQPASDEWLPAVDQFLQQTSWDETFQKMWQEITKLLTERNLTR